MRSRHFSASRLRSSSRNQNSPFSPYSALPVAVDRGKLGLAAVQRQRHHHRSALDAAELEQHLVVEDVDFALPLIALASPGEMHADFVMVRPARVTVVSHCPARTRSAAPASAGPHMLATAAAVAQKKHFSTVPASSRAQTGVPR